MAPLTQTENFQTSSNTRLNRINCERVNSDLLDLPAIVVSSSPEETFTLGLRIARLLKIGSVVAMRGELGAGKTCMAKGIARGLGVREEVTSPSYTIVSEYEGIILNENGTGKDIPVCFFHIDAFRLGGNKDFSDMGGEEIIFGNGISVIEWSDRIPGFVLDEALTVDIKIEDEKKRLIRVYWGKELPSGERNS